MRNFSANGRQLGAILLYFALAPVGKISYDNVNVMANNFTSSSANTIHSFI